MCFKVKVVLEMMGKEYEYKELDKDFTEQEFKSMFPNTISVPQVVMDGKTLGNANETLKYLNETMPLARLVWIMGADNLVQFKQWKRYEHIIHLLPIAVIDRPGYSYQAISAGRHLFARRYTARQLRRWLVKTRQDIKGWCFIAGQRHHASATDIRRHLDDRQSHKD